MPTVKNLLDDAMRYEMKSLVYCILYAIKKKYIQPNDPEENFYATKFTKTDNHEIAKLIEQNPLKLEFVKIYSLKMDKCKFAMIYAQSKEEAIEHYKKIFNRTPLNCHEFLLDYEIMQGNKPISYREMRKQFNSFPAYAGYMERGYK